MIEVRIGRGLPSVKIYIHPAETHRFLKFLFHIMGRLVPAHNKTVRLPLRFRQTKKLRYKQMEIFHQCFQYTPLNLSDFDEYSFFLQSFNRILKMKLLKLIYALYYSELKKKIHRLAYTLYSLADPNRSLCRVDLL